MQAQLKRLHSPDVDLTAFWPEDEGNFGFLLQAMIGPKGESSEESYDIQVCTPDWLKSKHSQSDVLIGQHLVIVFEYDLKRIENALAKFCERCTGDDWQEIAKKLSRIGRSEFDDYQQRGA